MLERAKANPKIQFKVPYTITKLLSNETGVIGALLTNTETGVSEEVMVDGIFYAIGHTPNSSVFKPWVEVDENDYIKVKEFTKTKTPGVFAAGDIADPNFRQAITAAGMGCQAAIQAQHYLEGLEH